MATTNDKKEISGDKLYIYQFSAPVVNQKTVFTIAKKFRLKADIKSGRFSESGDRYVYREGSAIVTVYKASGGLKFRDQLRWQSDDQKSSLDVKDEEAVKIAQDFIIANKIISLKDAKLLKVVRLIAATREIKSETTEQRIVGLEVAFQRVVDNINVDGPGGKLIVSIGQDKQVNSCEITWRDIHKKHILVHRLHKEEQSIIEAFKYLKVEKNKVSIHQVRFGFFEEGPKVTQKYLQPAYVIFIIITSPDNRFNRKTIYVSPAALNSIGRITPARRKIRRQPSREKY